MIIESLIQDAGIVTFDCAKATIKRGSRISIDDKFIADKEIQNAIAQGFCQIIGQIPNLPVAAGPTEPEKTVRFRNNYETKLCFECIKDYAAPGHLVRIPVSKLDEPEVRNAIAAGWLLNEDQPELNPVINRGNPLELEELTARDVLTWGESQILDTKAELPEGVPAARPRPKVQSQIKAKPITAAGSVDPDSDGDSSDLYRESKVHVPGPKISKKPKARPMIVEDVDEQGQNPEEDFDFSNIFSARQPKKK